MATAVTSASARVTPVRVTIVTRAGCHLCQDAEAAVAALSAELGFGWDAVDVDADPVRQDRYGDRVPVILVDGREHGYWRVEPERLRATLAGGDSRRPE
jgi:glutaredoxin